MPNGPKPERPMDKRPMKKSAARWRRWLDRLPAWVLTGVALVLLLWLTLAPKPFGETRLPLFPGADKVAHALMFGGLCVAVFLDLSHGPAYRRVSPGRAWSVAAMSTALGIAIEFIQGAMHLGRSFDPLDIAADFAGAVIMTLLWLRLQRYVTIG